MTRQIMVTCPSESWPSLARAHGFHAPSTAEAAARAAIIPIHLEIIQPLGDRVEAAPVAGLDDEAGEVTVAGGRPADDSADAMAAEVSKVTALLAEATSGMLMVTSTTAVSASSCRRRAARAASWTRVASARFSPTVTAICSLRDCCKEVLALKEATDIWKRSVSFTW
jgi:hypothetical protein